MDASDKKVKKPLALNVMSSSKHKGFGSGSIDLNNVSPVIIDEGKAYIDLGAMHAKSKVERGIKFIPNKEDVPNGRKCWIVWVAVDRTPEGACYGGLAACEMLVDTEAKRGWKILADHVNKMDNAMKRRIILDGLDAEEKAALRELLMTHNAEWWERSSDDLKAQLA
ncbi:YwhD family protein [Paenibacillus profundus]|uniref:YwhD family protein n=1 Tax=Paenibacillus profundus TaxID=1173085 RepID=A0ABS8YJY6_9BACL|nr:MULTISPECIES: YwhD family protein [Paenibacillus]MCE5172198.1 YwhD family protein [Paenibacillus profundus]MCM3342215.1 YwhD family protein [Paenibacillus sp. MER TA 81-3]